MAALTTTIGPIAVRCPLCGTPVELTVVVTPGLIEDVRMHLDATADAGPMIAHWASEHDGPLDADPEEDSDE